MLLLYLCAISTSTHVCLCFCFVEITCVGFVHFECAEPSAYHLWLAKKGCRPFKADLNVDNEMCNTDYYSFTIFLFLSPSPSRCLSFCFTFSFCVCKSVVVIYVAITIIGLFGSYRNRCILIEKIRFICGYI